MPFHVNIVFAGNKNPEKLIFENDVKSFPFRKYYYFLESKKLALGRLSFLKLIFPMGHLGDVITCYDRSVLYLNN